MEILAQIGGGALSLGHTLLAFLVVLTVVVFVHEMGHFLVGRWCGVGVKAFSIGFGPEIVGWNDRKGTRWKLSAIPLGGYVKFVGDVNGASVPDQEALGRMDPAERAISFPVQPLWKRAAIVAAGPIANFILAIAIFAGITYVNGRNVLTPRVEAVQPGSAAERAGFQPKDLILSIDGRRIESFQDMQRIVGARAEERLLVEVDRGGRRVTLEATPDLKENKTPLGTHRIGLLGIQASRDPADTRHVRDGLGESLVRGVGQSWYVVESTFRYLGKLVVGRESPDQLSGPIRIAQVSGSMASEAGFGGLVSLIAVLSVSIGLINLFPIPLLDGGHLLFYAIEGARGRPLSDRAQEIGFRIGLAIVLMLMLFSTWNDIVHLGSSLSSRGT